MDDKLTNFDLENRIRKIVQSLVEPTIRRSAEMYKTVSEMEFEIDNHKRKFEELDFTLTSASKKFNVMDEF
jgi:hypothetical protein